MSDDDWASIHQKVTKAGLLPGRSVRERLLELPDIDLLLDAAKAAGKKGMLDEAALDALLGEMKPVQTPVKEEVIARTIAPVAAPEPTPARPPRAPTDLGRRAGSTAHWARARRLPCDHLPRLDAARRRRPTPGSGHLRRPSPFHPSPSLHRVRAMR